MVITLRLLFKRRVSGRTQGEWPVAAGVAFDGIFENPIERGGFRGVCNGISA